MGKKVESLKDKKLIELTFNTLLNDYTPKNLSNELTDELIEEMLNFTPIYKSINSLIRGVVSRELVVRSDNNLEKDKNIIEIQKRINGIKNKTQFIESLVKSCFIGRTLNEIVYNDDFTIKEIVNIPYQLVKYDKDLKDYVLNANGEKIQLNDERKWLLSIYNKSIGYKLGRSMLESIVDDYNNIKELENKIKYLCNKYGETLLIFAYGVDTEDEEVQKTARELKAAHGRNVLAIPLSGGNLRDNIFSLRLTDMDTVIHERLIDKYEKNIVSTLLGGTLTIDNGGGSSSYSLGEIHQEEKEKIEDSIALYIRDELDKVIKIDGAFFGYDANLYYVSVERPENVSEQIRIEREKTDLINLKITGIESLGRTGYELDTKELSEYLGFNTLRLKESSPRLKEFEQSIDKREKKEKEFIELQEKLKKEVIEELQKNTRKEIEKIKSFEDILKIDIGSEKQYKMMVLSHLIGRYLTLVSVEKRKKEFEKEDEEHFSTIDATIKSLINRKPILYKELENIMEEEKHKYFWIKESQSLEMTKRIQEIFIKGLKSGKSSKSIFKDLKDSDILQGEKLNKNYWSGAIDMMIANAQARGNFEEMQLLKNDGFKYARYSAITDSRTTEICTSLHGKVMLIDDFEKHGLVPPLHYRCRSTLIQLEDSEVLDKNGNVRKKIKLATEKDIEHFKEHRQKGFGYIRESLENYVEEKQLDVEKRQEMLYTLNKEKELKEVEFDLLKKQLPAEEYEEYKKLINAHEPTRRLYELYANKLDDLELNHELGGGYLTKLNKVRYNFRKAQYEQLGKWDTLAHEMGHFFDYKAKFKNLTFNEVETLHKHLGEWSKKVYVNQASLSDKFLKALAEDTKHLRKIKIEQHYKYLNANDASAGVQDFIDGVKGTLDGKKLNFGHGNKYYNEHYDWIHGVLLQGSDLIAAYKELGFTNYTQAKSLSRRYNTAMECWANISSAVVHKEQIKFVEEYMPNMYKAFLEIINDVE